MKITVSLIFLKERKKETDRQKDTQTDKQNDRQRDKGRGRHKESLPRTDRYQDIKTHRRTAKTERGKSECHFHAFRH